MAKRKINQNLKIEITATPRVLKLLQSLASAVEKDELNLKVKS